MLADPVLGDRVLIAEPWDIGPGGYQLGNFPPPFLEWNDRYRDECGGSGAATATCSARSRPRSPARATSFRRPTTRSVNFIAAHDGFTLADLVAYRHKHNQANGEHNRDGHDENLSWNNGHEGPSDDPQIAGRPRPRPARAARHAVRLARHDPC